MNGFCFFVGATLLAVLPGPTLTLQWTHSVEKTQWEEVYQIVDDRLRLIEARVEGNGAGMEPGADARWKDGRWTFVPAVPALRELTLTRSPFVEDYRICSGTTGTDCHPMGQLMGPVPAEGQTVTLRACAAKPEMGHFPGKGK